MDITAYFKVDDKKSKKKTKIPKDKVERDKFLDILSDSVKEELIELDEYTDCIEFYNRKGSLIGILRFVECINKIATKYKDILELSRVLFKKVLIKEDDKLKIIDIKTLLSRFKKKSELAYSKDQIKGSRRLFNFLISNKQKCFGLYGYAGTGKTTLIVQIVDYLLNNNFINSVAFTAPTNKAVNIMKSKFRAELKYLIEDRLGSFNPEIHFDSYLDRLQEIGLNIDFITTHRLLNYQSEFDADGNRVFVKGKNSDIMNYDIVFIDECSMVSTDLISHVFEDISREIKKDKNSIRKIPKVVFVGDPAQLPPVNEEVSMIFNKKLDLKTFKKRFVDSDYDDDELKYKFNRVKKELTELKTFTLEEIVRSDDDKIVGLCNNIRKFVVGKIKVPKMGKFADKRVKIYKKTDNKIKSGWFESFMENRKKDVDSCIILTWTNNQTDLYNQEVRKRTVKNRDKKYNIGDILMVKDFYNFDESQTGKNHFYTSEQIKVVNTEELIKACPLFDCVLKKGQSMKCFRLIEGKYKEAVLKLNKETKRKYLVFRLECKKLSGDDKNTKQIYVIKDTSEEELEKDKTFAGDEIKKLRQYYEVFYSEQMNQIDKYIIKPLWREYNRIFIEPFANVTLGNSITCHTGQGSTYRQAYIDADDILKNGNANDAKRCMYTALTRASETVNIII